MANFDMPVTEYMTSPARTVGKAQPLSEVDFLLHSGGISALAVLDDDSLVGVLSRTDLLQEGAYGHDHTLTLPNSLVGEVMTTPAISVTADTSVSAAAKLMLANRIHRVFVTRDDALLGVISTRDLMRAVTDKGIRLPIAEIGSGSLVTVKADDPIAMAVDRLDRSNKHGLIVLDGEWPVGIFDQRAALAARGLQPEQRVDEAMNLAVLVLPSRMPLARAAEQALAMRVRRILVRGERGLMGIISGLDFARVVS